MSKKYVANIPPGTHLASSKNTYGAKRGTLLDDYTNEIVGQAEFIECDDEPYNEYNQSESINYDDQYDNDNDEDYDESEDVSWGEVLGGIICGGLAIGALSLFAKGISNSNECYNEYDDDDDEDDEYEIIENEKKELDGKLS